MGVIQGCAQLRPGFSAGVAEDQRGDGLDRIGFMAQQQLGAASTEFAGVGTAQAAGELPQWLGISAVSGGGGIKLSIQFLIFLHGLNPLLRQLKVMVWHSAKRVSSGLRLLAQRWIEEVVH